MRSVPRSTLRLPPIDVNRSMRSTQPRLGLEDAITGDRAYAPNTQTATTGRSCWIPTGTTSKPSTTDAKSDASGCHPGLEHGCPAWAEPMPHGGMLSPTYGPLCPALRAQRGCRRRSSCAPGAAWCHRKSKPPLAGRVRVAWGKIGDRVQSGTATRVLGGPAPAPRWPSSSPQSWPARWPPPALGRPTGPLDIGPRRSRATTSRPSHHRRWSWSRAATGRGCSWTGPVRPTSPSPTPTALRPT